MRVSSGTPSVEISRGKEANFLLMSTPISVAPATRRASGYAFMRSKSSARVVGLKKLSPWAE